MVLTNLGRGMDLQMVGEEYDCEAQKKIVCNPNVESKKGNRMGIQPTFYNSGICKTLENDASSGYSTQLVDDCRL